MQIVLEQENIILDVVLYLALLFSFDYERIRKSIVFLILIVCISFMNEAARNIFLIFFSSYVLSELRTTTIAKINLVLLSIVFLICSLFLFLGITESVLFRQTLLDMRVRWDYGMGNPNTFALFMYSILLNLYILTSQKNAIIVPLILTIGFCVYEYTGSRTFILSILILSLVHYVRKAMVKSSLVISLFSLSPLIILFLLMFLIKNVTNYTELDLLLSGRLTLYDNFLGSLSPVDYLVGTPNVNGETIDSSFLHLLFEGGIIVFITCCFMIKKTFMTANKESLKIYFPVFCSIFALGLTESVITFVLMFGNMIVWHILFRALQHKFIISH